VAEIEADPVAVGVKDWVAEFVKEPVSLPVLEDERVLE
jgi:hypothetical protein